MHSRSYLAAAAPFAERRAHARLKVSPSDGFNLPVAVRCEVPTHEITMVDA